MTSSQVGPAEPRPAARALARSSRGRAASARRRTAGDESDVFWDVSPAAFRVVWFALFALNLLIAMFVFALSLGYIALTYVHSVSYYAGMFRLISLDGFPIAIAGYAIVAMFYFARAVRFVSRSIHQRQLVFSRAPTRFAPSETSRMHSLRKPDEETRASALQRSQQRLYRMYGICSVRGVFFEPTVMTREVVEVAIQTWQAYACSKQSMKIWVNTSFAALIVINCYSTPILRRLLKPNERSVAGRYRVTVVCVDLALDLVWFVVIPVLLYKPYFIELLRGELILYHDTFIIEGVMELPTMLAASTFDVVLKLWPAVSTYFGMEKIELLTRRRASKKWLRYLLLYWGSAIAAVFIYANVVNTPKCSDDCQLVLRPWFKTSTLCTCAALRIDCSRLRIDGSASSIEQELRATDSKGLMSLVIAHCPALHVPDMINTLHDLYGLTVFNSTIVAWDTAAHISSSLHPNMGRVQLIHTFISEIPPSLLHANMPPHLLEIDIVASNLTRLPIDLHLLWPHVTTLLLDRGKFTEYPSVLSKMASLETISLFGNRIPHIPDDAMLNNHGLRFLHISENPVSSLPTSLAACKFLTNVLATQTSIEDVNSPVSNGAASMLAQLRVFGFGSPMCVNAAAQSSPARWLICRDRVFLYNGVESHAYYPLEAKLAESPAV